MNKFSMAARSIAGRIGVHARALAPTVARDGVGLGGLAAITRGVWMISAPAGWIVLGLLMVAVATLWSLASARQAG